MWTAVRQWGQPLYRSYQAIRARLATAGRRRSLLLAVTAQRKRGDPVRVILGGSGTTLHGWVTKEVDILDITCPADWSRYFRPGSIDRLLAEHVLEHLTETQNRAGLRLSFDYLTPGGFFRMPSLMDIGATARTSKKWRHRRTDIRCSLHWRA